MGVTILSSHLTLCLADRLVGRPQRVPHRARIH